ncbi:MAG TPA: response regulator [Caulobacteraceae bacterium]|nr:response regulator [Caulobacteraceae bacterium]
MSTAYPFVLVVDDDPVFQAIALEALAALTPNVQAAADGQQALAWLTDHAAEVVVTDINMPNRDGIQLIGDIRGRWPRTVIVAVSGGSAVAGADILLQTASLLGAYCVCHKPVSPHTLIKVVASALEQTRQDSAAADRRRWSDLLDRMAADGLITLD